MNKDSTVTLHTGNKMPILGLGSWQLNEDTAGTIKLALELGYRMIDTSSDYGSQPGIGEGIKQANLARDQFYLVTKVEEDDDAYARVKSNLEELQLDYADLMLIHRPPKDGSSGVELWQGLIRAKQEGLVKDIGVSNYSSSQIDQLMAATSETPVVNQIEWTPFGHSTQMLDYCREKKIIIQAYSPLTRVKKDEDPTLTEMSQKYNKTPAQVLIRWNLQLGTVPIPKANKREHLEENLEVFDFEISEEDMQRLNNLNQHYSSLGELPYL